MLLDRIYKIDRILLGLGAWCFGFLTAKNSKVAKAGVVPCGAYHESARMGTNVVGLMAGVTGFFEPRKALKVRNQYGGTETWVDGRGIFR